MPCRQVLLVGWGSSAGRIGELVCVLRVEVLIVFITLTTLCGLRRGVPVVDLLSMGWLFVGVPAVDPGGGDGCRRVCRETEPGMLAVVG